MWAVAMVIVMMTTPSAGEEGELGMSTVYICRGFVLSSSTGNYYRVSAWLWVFLHKLIIDK